MTYFVESNQFKQMISFKPYVTTKPEKKRVKYSLLNRIKEGLGDKWDRIKEGSKQAYDMICFFSAELGFFYASDEYLAEKHNISDRTVRNRLNELIELGEVIKVHRRAKRCNGRGKPIYLFVNHPYFQYWVNLLGIETDFQTDFQTGNTETSTDSREEQGEKVSTYSLPIKQENNIYIESQSIADYSEQKETLMRYAELKINDIVKKGVIVTYTSSYINRIFKSLETQALYYANELDKKRRQQRQQPFPFKEKPPFYNWLEQ